MTHTFNTRMVALAIALSAVLVSLCLTTAARGYEPEPILAIHHEVAPTHMVPGGMSQLVMTVRNVGNVPTSGPVTVSGELPDGVTMLQGIDIVYNPITTSAESGAWDCPVVGDGTTFECTSNPAHPGGPLQPKGVPASIYILVMADPGASGTGQSVVEAAGGGDPTPASSSAPYAVSADPAEFGIVRFAGWAVDRDRVARQAGAHPDLTTDIQLSTLDLGGSPAAFANMKDVEVELPPGVIGNPLALPRCSTADITSDSGADCPAESQVGTVDLTVAAGGVAITKANGHPVYNVTPPAGLPARLAFNFSDVVTYVDPVIRAEDDYAVTARVSNLSQSIPTVGSALTIWGVPQDQSHSNARLSGAVRGALSAAPRRPFVTAPTSCSGAPLETSMSIVSWQQPGLIRTASFDTDFEGDPIVNEGCERLAFTPSVKTALSSAAADSPAGLDVEIRNPQNLDSPDGLANAHLKDVEVRLPDGLTVNPSSATGLEACTDAQLGLGNDEPLGCPPGSKIGSAVARTPVLEEPVEGGVYLRPQASDDPESGEMFRLALVMDNPERGILVKLAGSVKADAETGKITASFEDNPQLPVESVEVSLKSGPRAPLATPASCGERTIDFGFASWAGHDVDLDSKVGIDCPGLGGFAPSFAAGSTNPVGGGASPFVVRVGRPDREEFVDGVEVDLPEGVLAKLAGVPLCSDADASAGTCDTGSRVGSATVGAGPGSNPFYLRDQPVFLAGPYKGAPYSLSVAARAVAGPFDLGMVVVRQALHVDPETAQVRVVSDRVPTIVKGVPLRLRSIDVSVDRSDFARNPTSCSVKRVAARLRSQQGSSHSSAARFQVGDCQALGFRPRLAMRLTGRKQTRTGGHPSLRAVVSQGGGQANIAKASVTLPKSLALDAVNSYDPKLVCDYDASLRANCPESSVIGTATAETPLLDRPLTGKVHLVQGIKFGPAGNRVRTTPSLLVKLRGQVDLNLRARTTVRNNRLVTTFARVPDGQVTRFAMSINGGSDGILVVTRTRRSKINICSSKQTATVKLDGHNGRNADYNTKVKTPCAKTKARGKNTNNSSKRGNRR